MMFTTVQDDVCMIMKFLSNSPVTHISANTHPAVPTPAVITITCNHNFAVNKWNHVAGNQGMLPVTSAPSHECSLVFPATSQQTPSPSYAEKQSADQQPQLPLSMDQLLGEPTLSD